MKLFTAAFATESCDLTPVPTDKDVWSVTRPNDGSAETNFSRALQVFRDKANQYNWDIAESICALAYPPGGRIVRQVYEDLRTTLLEDLQAAMPVDAVLLQLHGAAMAYGYNDCEGDLLKHIRAIVGSSVPIGVELDPHCHITDLMMGNATVIVCYKTFYHTDMSERAGELFDMVARTLAGDVKPVMSLFDCRMIETDAFDEAFEPMKSFLAEVYQQEKNPDVLSISPVHGYPLADLPEMGSKMLVVTNNDIALAQRLAENLGQSFFNLRGQVKRPLYSMDNALSIVEEKLAEGESQIVLSECNDSGGYGFPTDGTVLLNKLLDRGITNFAVGCLWDPMAVSLCHQVGMGVTLSMRIGGKAAPMSGVPVDCEVTIQRLYQAINMPVWGGGVVTCDAAVVSSGKKEFLLTSKRILGTGIEPFTAVDMDIHNKQVLLLKFSYGQPEKQTTQRTVLNVADGCLDYKTLPFTHIQRPKWPWDKKPFEQFAETENVPTASHDGGVPC